MWVLLMIFGLSGPVVAVNGFFSEAECKSFGQRIAIARTEDEVLGKCVLKKET